MVANYNRVAAIKREVNTRRYNRIDLSRRLRLASFIPYPRLVKGFHNKPRMK